VLIPSANSEIAYAVLKRVERARFLIPKRRNSRGDITPDEANGTFTFGITVGLQNPLNL
jgi:hypothetical protein